MIISKPAKTQGNLFPKLVPAAGWVIIFMIALAGCVPDTQNGSPHPQSATAVHNLPVDPLLKSVKPAQGFVILLTGNWQGHLAPCGCTEVQLGGIDRRTQVLRRIAPDTSRRLLVDAGPLIEKHDRQAELKFSVFLHSLKHLQYDAISITPQELNLLEQKLDWQSGVYSTILASNIPAEARMRLDIQPYLHKTLQYRGRKLDCLVFALLNSSDVVDRAEPDRWQLQEPFTALMQQLRQAGVAAEEPSRDKVVIVLCSRAEDALIEKLQKVPALDILVVRGYADEPQEFGGPSDSSPLTVSTGKLGKYITRIDIAPSVEPSRENLVFSAVAINSDYPRDKQIEKYIEDYQDVLKMENPIAREDALPRKPLPDDLKFVGSQACAGCHDGIYDAWQKLKHGHAMETLKQVKRNYDPECVVCHSVGMEYVSGYRSEEKTPDLANVGCEMCHGPGSDHVMTPDDSYHAVFTACETCHDHENSPDFADERADYFKNIQHWHEPRRYWK